MKKVKVAAHLTDKEYQAFLTTYSNHNASIGTKEREAYNMGHVTEVKRNIPENCLNVYFDNGEWLHYTPDGKWY